MGIVGVVVMIGLMFSPILPPVVGAVVGAVYDRSKAAKNAAASLRGRTSAQVAARP